MDPADILGPVFAMVLTTLVVAWVGRRNNAPPEIQDGLMHFRMPGAFFWIGWLCVGIALFFLAGITLKLDQRWPVLFLFIAAFVLLLWLGILLVRDARYHQAACNDDILVVIDRRNQLQSCRWSDIVTGRVHPFTRMIQLRTHDARKLSVSPFLRGSDTLFAIMARRTSLNVKNLVARARAAA